MDVDQAVEGTLLVLDSDVPLNGRWCVSFKLFGPFLLHEVSNQLPESLTALLGRYDYKHKEIEGANLCTAHELCVIPEYHQFAFVD